VRFDYKQLGTDRKRSAAVPPRERVGLTLEN